MKMSDRSADPDGTTRKFRSAKATVVAISVVAFPFMILGIAGMADGAIISGALMSASGLMLFLHVATSSVVLSESSVGFRRYFRTTWSIDLSSARAVDGVVDGVLPTLQIFHRDGRMVGSILKGNFEPYVIEQVRAAIDQRHRQ